MESRFANGFRPFPIRHLGTETENQEIPFVAPIRSNRPVSRSYRKLIHLLNQRYRQEWERAERLRAELDNLRRSPVWPLFRLLRWFKRRLRPVSPPEIFPSFSIQKEPKSQIIKTLPFQVSIIIPFKDRPDLLRGCLRSLRGGTHRRFEIVLVNNGSAEHATLRFLNALKARRRFQVANCPGPFNFSLLCNEGARHAQGHFFLFLNNDVEAINPDWLQRMLEVAIQPNVAIVGATLLYPDWTIQHAGIFPRSDGQWVHVHRGRPLDHPGEQGELRLVREVPAVTGASLLIARDRFEELGGFDENLPLTLNDVDLCCRARERGWQVMVTPHARLFHYESLTRGYGVDRSGMERMAWRADQPRPMVPAP
jgi:GT2 family glycosyltransferase